MGVLRQQPPLQKIVLPAPKKITNTIFNTYHFTKCIVT